MSTTVAFSTNVFIPSKSNRLSPSISGSSASPVRCTAAPERTRKSTSKKLVPSKYYRILPDNPPVSERPPSPPRHYTIPYVGFFAEYFLGLFDDGFKGYHKKYGPIFLSNLFLGPMYYVGSYGAAVDIMKNNEVFISKDAFPGMVDMFGEDSLFLIDGKDHSIARAALAPAFSTVLLPYYLKKVVKRSKGTWNRVHEKVQKDGKVLFDPMFREHYLAITIEMTTGVAPDSQKMALFCELFTDIMNSFVTLPFMPAAKKGIAARQKILDILRDVIIDNLTHRRETIEKLRKYGDEVMKFGMKDISSGNVDVLLVSIANSALSIDENDPVDEELVGALSRTMLLLWFAGFVTSAITSTCASFELGIRPEMMSRLVQEQDDIVAAGDQELTYHQVHSQMPLLDSYIMEILRLFPAADSIARKTTRDMEILGKFVPKGSRLQMDFTGPHRDESIYMNADSIIPERWLQHPKPPPVLSFGAPGSAHYCIGAAFAKMMMKTTFATMLREYEFGLDPNQSKKYRFLPDHTPESGVVVNKFKRRT